MSAPSCLVVFGVRMDVKEDELESLEERTHAHMIAARQNHLQHYWGNFGQPDENYFLFIGTVLGVFGPENLRELNLSEEKLIHVMRDTKSKLQSAGFAAATASLHVQWMPDV